MCFYFPPHEDINTVSSRRRGGVADKSVGLRPELIKATRCRGQNMRPGLLAASAVGEVEDVANAVEFSRSGSVQPPPVHQIMQKYRNTGIQFNSVCFYSFKCK